MIWLILNVDTTFVVAIAKVVEESMEIWTNELLLSDRTLGDTFTCTEESV